MKLDTDIVFKVFLRIFYASLVIRSAAFVYIVFRTEEI